jgi:Protein of unknwon function (DUF3310)
MTDKQVGGDHYKNMDLEPLTVIDAWAKHWPKPIVFYLGNAIKYIARCGRKPGAAASLDLRKAIHYLELAADFMDESDEQRQNHEAYEMLKARIDRGEFYKVNGKVQTWSTGQPIRLDEARVKGLVTDEPHIHKGSN